MITVEAKRLGTRVIATVKVGISTGRYTYTVQFADQGSEAANEVEAQRELRRTLEEVIEALGPSWMKGLGWSKSMRGQSADSGGGQYPIPKTDGKAERCSSAIDRFHGILKMENQTTLFCSARTKSPICSPSTRSIGRANHELQCRGRARPLRLLVKRSMIVAAMRANCE
jgi:hypothetical protein